MENKITYTLEIQTANNGSVDTLTYILPSAHTDISARREAKKLLKTLHLAEDAIIHLCYTRRSDGCTGTIDM